MNSKNTWLWFLLAASLFATIWLLDHQLHAPPPSAANGWPAFRLARVTSVQVIPANALEIRAEHTNDNWYLAKPIQYPAEPAAIQALLDALARLTPTTRITASELRQQPAAEADYGFDPPQTSLVVAAGNQRWEIKIGNLTAPHDQVFLRVVGVDGAFVTDAGWLKYLPQKPSDWRDTSLVNTSGRCDWIVLTNGARVLEFRLDPTNHLWRMARPLQARADSDRVNRALQQLKAAQVQSFVTDDARADLTAYELQPANFDLWLGHDATLTEGLHTGKTLTNNPAQVFAKREGWSGVVTTWKEPLTPWRGTVNDFRSTHLFEISAPVNELEVRFAGGVTNHYTLQNQGSNVWQEAGESFPVDTQGVQFFLKYLARMTNSEFITEGVTPTDLETYGLTNPQLQITLRPVAGDTNRTLAQLSFSAQRTNGLFVRRSDEDFIYRLNPDDLINVPRLGLEFRERQIWKVPEHDIAQITVRQNGQSRSILHKSQNNWEMAPGSPGQVYGPTIEEIAHEIGNLAAVDWVFRNVTPPEAETLGVTTNSQQIEITVKTGRKYTLDVGGVFGKQPIGLVTLDGERWAFILPNRLYEYLLSFLTIPATVP